MAAAQETVSYLEERTRCQGPTSIATSYMGYRIAHSDHVLGLMMCMRLAHPLPFLPEPPQNPFPPGVPPHGHNPSMAIWQYKSYGCWIYFQSWQHCLNVPLCRPPPSTPLLRFPTHPGGVSSYSCVSNCLPDANSPCLSCWY